MRMYLLVISGAIKDLFHPAWVLEHLLFFTLGLLFVFGLRRMKLPRWSLFLAPALYLMGELVLWLAASGIIHTGGTATLLLYDPVRYLLFFSLGEGAGLLLRKWKP